MRNARVRRSGVILVSAVLLASLAVVTTSAPASAKPTCRGKPATIVGTNKSEVIRGTNGRDVIVARGGDDRIYGRGGYDLICGGPGDDRLFGGRGRDRLYGNAGNDRLVGGAGRDRIDGGFGRDTLIGGSATDYLEGGPHNDRLNGGEGHDDLDGSGGYDSCHPGRGSGPHHDCEDVPRLPPRNLAIAWSDLDGDHRYGPGDVLISRLFDTNGDGIPSPGDTVFMGKYPIDFEMTGFADWGVASHTVTGPAWFEVYRSPPWQYSLHEMAVETESGENYWVDGGSYKERESYAEWRDPSSSYFVDALYWDEDGMVVEEGSPSQPQQAVGLTERPRTMQQDQFIDTEVYP